MYKLKVLIGAAFIIVVLLGISLAYLNSGRTFTAPEWNSIKIGESDKQSVYDSLGRPISSSGKIESFESESPTTPHQVIFDESNKTEFIRQVVTLEEEVTFSSIVEQYGDMPIRLYGPEASFEIYLYTNPASGVAVLGNKDDNTVMEVWYFKPTDLQTFLSTWAQDYSVENTPHGD